MKNRLWSIVLAGGDGTRLRPLRSADPFRRPTQAVRRHRRLPVAPQTDARPKRSRHTPRTNRRRRDSGARALLRERVLRRREGPDPARRPRHGGRHPLAGAMDQLDGPDGHGRGVPVRPLHRRRRSLHARDPQGGRIRRGFHPERIFLIGARPDSPETGYGWIEPEPSAAIAISTWSIDSGRSRRRRPRRRAWSTVASGTPSSWSRGSRR